MELSIAVMARSLRRKETTAETLTREAIARAKASQDKIHAFIRLDEAGALKAARQADAELAAGQDRGPLHGVPYAVKDIYDVKGVPTTCGSRLKLDDVAAEDSTVVRKLADAGAVLLGKLNTHEFALGGPSLDLPFPAARNPWKPDHVTGGSSSGSGAASGGGLVALAMGSDTTGSIRVPAAYCGAVGLKPTFGRVSTRGVFPLAPSLDHAGPLTHCVEDAAIALGAIAGHDPRDPASVDRPVADYRAQLEGGVKGLRIGVLRDIVDARGDATLETVAALDRIATLLRDAGARVETATLPEYETFSTCGQFIMIAEAIKIHEADLKERPQLYGVLFRERLTGAMPLKVDELTAALQEKQRLAKHVDALFDRYDLLLTASSYGPAPHFDNPAPPELSPYRLVTPFNVSGNPAISVPVGLSANGLPLGLQLAGRRFDEAILLRGARAVEKLSGWENIAPPALS